MADASKHLPLHTGTLAADLKSLLSLVKTRRTTIAFAYGFMLAFVAVTVFLAFSPSSNSSAPWFTNIFSASFSASSPSTDSHGSQFSSVFSYFFPNSSSSSSPSFQKQKQVHNLTSYLSASTSSSRSDGNNQSIFGNSTSQSIVTTSQLPSSNNTQFQPPGTPKELPLSSKNDTNLPSPTPAGTKIQPPIAVTELASSKNKTTVSGSGTQVVVEASQKSLSKEKSDKAQASNTNQAAVAAQKAPMTASSPQKTGTAEKDAVEKGVLSNNTASLTAGHSDGTKQESATVSGRSAKQGIENLIQSLMNCDLFDGNWVKDETYPLYKPGSCSFIDEQFSCILNGRPDTEYQKYKWKPKACTLPRLNGAYMLELLRGKRLVFVGDSLNRNMWESLVCVLRGAAKDPKNVYEANGRSYFRGEVSYSFVFKDYDCTIEFFVSPFLVREWEVSDNNGTKKETLRLDLVGKSSDQYRGADIIIFNTGHWWTHEKTSKGKDYYQEGSHVYGDLNVLEAFRKALTTWARWVDANVNPLKSMVFFRGYSLTHFSGGQWNSGGACDSETEPIKNEKYLTPYPSKMLVLEKVLRGMKTHVTYLNISRLTDFRKDAHPSVYRKHDLTDEERKSPLRFQDCSHWCLPGVPDAWNELLFAELLVKEKKMRQHQRKS